MTFLDPRPFEPGRELLEPGAAGHRPVRLRSADLVLRGVAEAAAAAEQEETGADRVGTGAGRA